MFTRPIRFTCACALAAAVSAAGCAGSRAGRASGGDDPSRPAPRRGPGAPFETSRDPPIASETRYAAGQLAESRGAYAQAIEQYRHALRRDPKHLPSLYRTGVVYAEMRRYDDAIAAWKRYTAATADSAAGYSNLGFCYELARRPEEAETAYLKGIRKDPRHVACRVNYGLMLVRSGREGEGRLQLQSVLKPAEVHYNVGSVFESLGRPAQAKAEYGKAIDLDPNFADAQARLDALRAAPGAPAPQPAPPAAVSQTE